MPNEKTKKTDDRKIAIYSRKSRYTGKGESTHNQIEACKRKIGYTFDNIDMDEDVIIYEDEGFSGYNTNRPAFQQMMADVRAKKIKAISFYKLDRISRNVSDFSNLVTEIGTYDVTFISATESLENVTPSGRAMMFMISVFAQFERDVIAERIRDNMIELAKTGRWLGGMTPTGFQSEKIETISVDGKTRRLFKLSPIEEEKNMVTLIFSKMLELRSLTKLETYAIQNNLQTKNGKGFTRWTLKSMLMNPVYAMADEDTLEYFRRFEVDIYADEKDFNGTHGLMVYNKTKKVQKKIERRDFSDWIIAIGKHKGFVSGKKWVEVQDLIEQNSDMRYRKPSTNEALLSGIIRCEQCGSFMRPRLLRETSVDEKGRRKFVYMCELKDKSKKQKCQCKNVNGLEADDIVSTEIKKLSAPSSLVCQQLKKLARGEFTGKDRKGEEIKSIKNAISKNETSISTLLDRIKYVDVELVSDISAEIMKLKEKNNELRARLKELTEESTEMISDAETAELVLHILKSYKDTFDELDLNTKKNMIKMLISSVTSDGETLRINFLGVRDIDDSDYSNDSNRRELQTSC